jgi:polygalacturonase
LCLQAAVFDVTAFGAKGDGKTQNRQAINRAIEAAATAGGGTVEIPPGTWVTGSIRLRSNVTLRLERGSVIEASSVASEYDAPEPNAWDKFQDFGHSHFHNSLIWGERLENIAIVGSGRISGKALTRDDGQKGNDKAIALKLCHNVTLRDFSISNGGHFGILAAGVDNLTIDNIMIDTNRDGIDTRSILYETYWRPNRAAVQVSGTRHGGKRRI